MYLLRFERGAAADAEAHYLESVSEYTAGTSQIALCGAIVPLQAPGNLSPEEAQENPVCSICRDLSEGIVPKERQAEPTQENAPAAPQEQVLDFSSPGSASAPAATTLSQSDSTEE
jgi:hypothetical protein